MGCTPEIKHNQVVIHKENGGDEGSKQFSSNYITNTLTLKPGFGAAKNFIPIRKDGKEADAGNTKHTLSGESCRHVLDMS